MSKIKKIFNKIGDITMTYPASFALGAVFGLIITFIVTGTLNKGIDKIEAQYSYKYVDSFGVFNGKETEYFRIYKVDNYKLK